MISSIGIENREALLAIFGEPRKLRDALIIVGASPEIDRGLMDYIKNDFAPFNSSYRDEMYRIFSNMSGDHRTALIQLSREIIDAEIASGSENIAILLEYVPNE